MSGNLHCRLQGAWVYVFDHVNLGAAPGAGSAAQGCLGSLQQEWRRAQVAGPQKESSRQFKL